MSQFALILAIYTMHVNGIKIATSLMTDITSKPGLVNTASGVVNVLARFNNTTVTSQDKLQVTADICRGFITR